MPQSPERCRVAVSDDSPEVRAVCKNILKYFNITNVLCIESREEFKEKLEEIAACDILVLDSFGLRDKGNSLARSYAEKNQHGKIIRFYDAACISPEIKLIGDYYVQKPFNSEGLMVVIWKAQNAPITS